MSSYRSSCRRTVSLSLLVGAVALAASATAQATVIALTENTNGFAVSGSGLDPAFSGFSTATFATTENTFFSTNGAANYVKQGANFSTTSIANIVKFDLSAIPAGATINTAQIQLHALAGNTGAASTNITPITSQDWTDALATRAGPLDPTSPALGWGPGANALYTIGVDAPGTNAFDHISAIGDSFLIEDVTTDVTAFLGGTNNFGWELLIGNRSIQDTSDADGDRPVLFIDFTSAPEPVVPEPSTFALLLMGGAILARVRRRR